MNSAANLSSGIKMSCAARSGFHYALAVLYEDALKDALSRQRFDSLHEAWADFESLNSDVDSAFEDVEFEVRIYDRSGRINVNRLVKQTDPGKGTEFDDTQKDILTRLLKSLDIGLEEEEVGDIVNSIKDWIDQDDDATDEGGLGAESTYYQGLNKPYSCRNGPLESLEELYLIKGITDEIYDEISKYLTIYGGAGININTANKKVLESILGEENSEFAVDMIEYRDEEKNDLSKTDWYKEVSGMKDITLGGITVTSTHFEIVSTGSKGDMKKVVSRIVERENNGTLRVPSRKVE